MIFFSSCLFFYSLSFFLWQYYKCIHHTLITSPYFSLLPPILYMHTLHTDCLTPTLASLLPPTILCMHTLHPDRLTPTSLLSSHLQYCTCIYYTLITSPLPLLSPPTYNIIHAYTTPWPPHPYPFLSPPTYNIVCAYSTPWSPHSSSTLSSQFSTSPLPHTFLSHVPVCLVLWPTGVSLPHHCEHELAVIH